MSDHSKINFSQDYELNYILSYQFSKRETEQNRNILREIGDFYKNFNNVTIVTDKPHFYEYAKGHNLFSSLG